MIGDVTVEQPCFHIVGSHVYDLGGRREQFHRIGSRATPQRRIAVPMGDVKVGLVAKAHQLPTESSPSYGGFSGAPRRRVSSESCRLIW